MTSSLNLLDFFRDDFEGNSMKIPRNFHGAFHENQKTSDFFERLSTTFIGKLAYDDSIRQHSMT